MSGLSLVVIAQREKYKKILVGQRPLLIYIFELDSILEFLRYELLVAYNAVYIIHLCIVVILEFRIYL